MKIERLNRTDKVEAVNVLVSAFHEYPVMRYVLKSAGEKYERDLRALIGFFCETRLIRNLPLLGIRFNDELVAVAGINDPEIKPMSPELKKVYTDLKSTIGKDAIKRLETYEKKSDPKDLNLPHHFLGIIGVKPVHQGKGHAKKIIEEVHRMSETHLTSKGVCLCTENSLNVPLYEHLGYKIISEADVGDIHTWSMYRENSM